MAIFHYTVKIVGRSKGKSIISASAYLNGDVMKNEETGRISYYTSKKEVVYTSLLMCENAPQEWQNVPAENIRRFQKSVRYKRADNQNAALEKFKLTFQKQRLWNEVLRIEKSSDAQLGRSFEFSLPKEWSRQEQIDYTTEYIQKTFVDKGMCADSRFPTVRFWFSVARSVRAVLLYLAKDLAAWIIRCLSFLNSGSAPEKTGAACPVPAIPVPSLP
jgi:hypothetical protein